MTTTQRIKEETNEQVEAHKIFAKSLFRIGDTVRVVRKVESHSYGWRNSWVTEMDKTVGRIGTILDINDGGVAVDISEINIIYGFCVFSLEKIASKIVKLNNSYSAEVCGDIVKVGGITFPRAKVMELYDACYKC